MLPIIRNTVTGILGVDQNVREAAVAMGMTDGQILWQVELPLAMSVYFVAEFSQPFLVSDIVIDKTSAGSSEARGTNIKAFFQFSTLSGVPLLAKVALSGAMKRR